MTHVRTVTRPALAVCGAVALLVGTGLAGRAVAAPLPEVPETGVPGRLVLASWPQPATFDLAPGRPGYWQVDARLEDAPRADLELELHSAGALARHEHGLRLTVRRCEVPWQGVDGPPACASGAREVGLVRPGRSTGAPGDGPRFALGLVHAGAPQHLLVELALGDTPTAAGDESLMALTGSIGVGLRAVAVPPDPATPTPDPGATDGPGGPGGPGGGDGPGGPGDPQEPGGPGAGTGTGGGGRRVALPVTGAADDALARTGARVDLVLLAAGLGALGSVLLRASTVRRPPRDTGAPGGG